MPTPAEAGATTDTKVAQALACVDFFTASSQRFPSMRFQSDSNARLLRSRHAQIFEGFYSIEEVPPIHHIVEALGGITPTQVGQQLLERIRRAAHVNPDGAQISRLAQAGEELVQRISALQCQPTGTMSAAHQVLNE